MVGKQKNGENMITKLKSFRERVSIQYDWTLFSYRVWRIHEQYPRAISQDFVDRARRGAADAESAAQLNRLVGGCITMAVIVVIMVNPFGNIFHSKGWKIQGG